MAFYGGEEVNQAQPEVRPHSPADVKALAKTRFGVIAIPLQNTCLHGVQSDNKKLCDIHPRDGSDPRACIQEAVCMTCFQEMACQIRWS